MLLLYRLRTDPTENTAFIVGEACLPSRFLAIEIYSWGADHLENISIVLLTANVCWTVYRAVAWQRSNQIRYSIKKLIAAQLIYIFPRLYGRQSSIILINKICYSALSRDF
jgi:hypothetical protein